MDIIRIKRLRIDTFVGVYAHEQDNKQAIYIDLSIQMDASAAFASDNIEDALDYVKSVHSRSNPTNQQLSLIEKSLLEIKMKQMKRLKKIKKTKTQLQMMTNLTFHWLRWRKR